MKLKRCEGNPVLLPVNSHGWENRAVFNPAVVYLDGKIHLVYRAQGEDTISRLGYAVFDNRFNIVERLSDPVYVPRDVREKYGCEDPRMVVVEDTVFMLYTAYGEIPLHNESYRVPQIAITNIKVSDFLSRQWNWNEPVYPFPYVDDKDAVIFPERFDGKFVMYHRIFPHIWVSYSEDGKVWGSSDIFLSPKYEWEYFKIGVGTSPLKTSKGWLVFYHGVDNRRVYRLGYFIVSLDNPTAVLYRSPEPILEPVDEYERFGNVSDVVFTCGAVLLDNKVFVFYGAADRVVGIACGYLEEFYCFLQEE